MQSNVILSIIVPIYNSEKYLERCIDSVLAQSFSEFELILVDDGSTDESLGICESYTQKDRRIRVFRQANSGQAAARNVGFKNSRGKYIAFLDSDDYVKPQMYRILLDAMDETDADIVKCGFDHIRDIHGFRYGENLFSYTDKDVIASFGPSPRVMNEKDYLRVVCTEYGWASPCNAVHKRELLERERFTEKTIMEDFALNVAWCRQPLKVAVVADKLYCYMYRDGSTMHSDNIRISFHNCVNYVAAMRIANECGDTDLYAKLWDLAAFYGLHYYDNADDKKNAVLVQNMQYLLKTLKVGKTRYLQIKMLLWKISPSIYSFVLGLKKQA